MLTACSTSADIHHIPPPPPPQTHTHTDIHTLSTTLDKEVWNVGIVNYRVFWDFCLGVDIKDVLGCLFCGFLFEISYYYFVGWCMGHLG